jgi:hydroxypyruvate reductase
MTLKKLFKEAEDIFRAGVEAVDPRKLVRDSLDLSGAILTVGGDRYDLNIFERIYLLGAGKACDKMATGVEELLGDRLAGGVIINPYGTAISTPRVPRRIAAHPIPDDKGVRAAEELISIAATSGPGDLVIVLLSGGGSALLSAPAEGILLEDLQIISEVLLKCGASINELNTVRKHLSRIKGGGLARILKPALVITLIISDVVGDDPAVIASSPTAPDPTSFRDCLEIIDRYEIREKVPSRIMARLKRGRGGMIPDTPDGASPVFEKVRNIIIGNNRLALRGAAEEARRLGYQTIIISDRITGDTHRAAELHCALAAAVKMSNRSHSHPLCILSGGETTVAVKGPGLGGRNTEFVLACARKIAGWRGLTILSGGTDGIDGSSPAAGAICDGATISRGKEIGLNAGDFLNRNDSYTYFQALDDLLITGPTGTNVMDIRILLVE